MCYISVVTIIGCSVCNKHRLKYVHSCNKIEHTHTQSRTGSSSQDTTALQPNSFLNEIHRLLVTNLETYDPAPTPRGTTVKVKVVLLNSQQ